MAPDKAAALKLVLQNKAVFCGRRNSNAGITRIIMLLHALTIVINELNSHLGKVYPGSYTDDPGKLGNIAEVLNAGNGAAERDGIYLSVVNIREEKALKNVPNYVRNDVALTVSYQNPPVFLNFQILVAATHKSYTNALLELSRVIRFFQSRNVFTQDNVDPGSIPKPLPVQELDQLEAFKLIFDLYSPTMEEVNHLWGTLGGKQCPFVWYTLRMLDLKFKEVSSENGLITEVISDFYHKNGVTK